MKNSIFLSLFLLCHFLNQAQNVGIGTTTPDGSAVLELTSNSQGFLCPRMTTEERWFIEAPAVGLMVYDIDKRTIYLYDGFEWLPMMKAMPTGYHLTTVSLPTGETSDQFGTAVSMDGNYAVVGAPGARVGPNTYQGSVHVYVRTSGQWVQQAVLTASDGSASDLFGSCVDIHGDYIIAGTPNDDFGSNLNQGSAYVFKRDGTNWIQQTKLFAADGQAQDYFGKSVAICEDYAIAGLPKDDMPGFYQAGSAIIFKRSGMNWVFQVQLFPANPSNDESFGESVTINDTWTMVGCPGHMHGGIDGKGGVYAYERVVNTWEFQNVLVHPTLYTAMKLGSSIALDNNTMVAGGPEDVLGGTAAVFVYSGTIWNFQKELTPTYNEVNVGDWYGVSVAVSGDYVFIGAMYDVEGYGPGHGSVYIWKRNGTDWQLLRKITHPDVPPNAQFGSSVAASGYNVIVGAPIVNLVKGDVSFFNFQ